MKHKSLIFLFISFLILGVMLWFVGIGDILGALKIANLWFIALAVLIQVFTYYLYTLRWQIINKMDGIEIPFPVCILFLLFHYPVSLNYFNQYSEISTQY